MIRSKIAQYLRIVRTEGVRTDSIIIRNGCIIGKSGSPNLESKWSSASKIWYSVFAMLLAQRKIIESLDDEIGKYFSSGHLILSTADKKITWRHLMNMESGYAHADAPGEHFAYNDRAIELFVEALKRAYGTRDLNTVAYTKLSSLRFTGKLFDCDDRSIANLYDFAKLLFLLMNKGYWQRKCVIDPKILEDAFSHIATRPISAGSDDAEGYLDLPTVGGGANQTRRSLAGPGEYACNSWINKKRKMGMPVDLVQANGNWGRAVALFVPSLRLIALTRIAGYLPGEGDDRLHNPYNGVIAENIHILREAITTDCPPDKHLTAPCLPDVIINLLQ